MKSTVKKSIILGLGLISSLNSIFAAPKSKKSDPYKTVEKKKDPQTKKVYDFKGLNIVLGDWWTDPNAQPASKAQEDQKRFHEWLESTYNMKVVQKQVAGWSSTPQFVSNYCMTGDESDPEKYFFTIDGRSANVGIKAGLFYDLSKVSSVDYTDSKIYDQVVVKLLAKGSSFYAFNFGVSEPREGMFFNKRLLAEAGYDPDYPYDLQKEGKWTWDTFKKLLDDFVVRVVSSVSCCLLNAVHIFVDPEVSTYGYTTVHDYSRYFVTS